MVSESPQIIHEKDRVEVALIAEIIAYGNQRGEFDVADVIATAETVQNAIVLFDAPNFMGLFPLEWFRAWPSE